MQPGQLVRLIGSPGEIGTFIGGHKQRGDRVYVTVGFPGGKRTVPIDQVELIKAGKPIRYVGATGPLEYDQYGDVSAPTMQWKIDADGKIVEGGQRTLDEVRALFKQIDG